MGEMEILGKKGKKRLTWDSQSKEKIAIAEMEFKKRLEQGFLAFHCTKNGSPGTQIHTFDPAENKIIILPPVVGG